MINEALPEAVIGADWIADREDGTVSLAITRCECGSCWFPPSSTCLHCLAAGLEPTYTDPDAAVVYASTTVRAAPARFGAPYVLAYLDASGVRFLARVEAQTAPAPGTPVRLRRGVIARDGDAVTQSWVAYPIERADPDPNNDEEAPE